MLKALLECREAELEATGTEDIKAVIELRTNHDRELGELVRRCRELLAQADTTGCPPGHWLG